MIKNLLKIKNVTRFKMKYEPNSLKNTDSVSLKS